MKNEYFGISSILSLSSVEQGILLKFIEELGIKEKADNNYSIPALKQDINIYDKSKSTTLIYCNFNIGQINRVVIDVIGNYIYNRYKQDKSITMYNIFSLISSYKFNVKIIDGMTLVDNRMSNISLNEYMFDTGILFIVSKVHEANYKNYHLVINDVIRAREYANKPTIVFFYGSKKDAKEFDYLYVCPREIDCRKSSTKAESKKETNFIEDSLVGDILI